MAKKDNKRIDAVKNKGKVIKSLLKDPMQTIPEIAKDTWLSFGNVHDKLKQVEREGVKDGRIIAITETDLENVILWQNELQRRLQEWADKLKTQEIVQIMSEGTARYTKFRWDVTNPDGWERRHLDEKQLKAIDSILSYLSPNE